MRRHDPEMVRLGIIVIIAFVLVIVLWLSIIGVALFAIDRFS